MWVQVSVASEIAESSAAASTCLLSAKEPAPIKELSANEILFHVGDRRAYLYRVESGSICIYEPRLRGSHAVIDFAFPGDFVGLGFLKKQTCTARAIAVARVSCLPITSIDSLVAGNPRAEAKLAQAIEKEFELHKASIVDAGRHNPIERVAALLVALSQVNRHEGGDPNVIAPPWHCGAVADQLELNIDELAQSLLELEGRGLIEAYATPGSMQGLRIKDHNRLEQIADRGASGRFADGNSIDEPVPTPRVSSTSFLKSVSSENQVSPRLVLYEPGTANIELTNFKSMEAKFGNRRHP